MALERKDLLRIVKATAVMVSLMATAVVIFFGLVLINLTKFQDTELNRVSNPGGTLDAVIMGRISNSTNTHSHLVFIVPKNQSVITGSAFHQPSNPVFAGEHAPESEDGVSVAVNWDDDGHLSIHSDGLKVYFADCRASFQVGEAMFHEKMEYSGASKYEVLDKRCIRQTLSD